MELLTIVLYVIAGLAVLAMGGLLVLGIVMLCFLIKMYRNHGDFK